MAKPNSKCAWCGKSIKANDLVQIIRPEGWEKRFHTKCFKAVTFMSPIAQPEEQKQ